MPQQTVGSCQLQCFTHSGFFEQQQGLSVTEALQGTLTIFSHLLLSFRAGAGSGFELDRPTALRLQQLMPSLDHNHLQGKLGPALIATLSTDVQLRQTLLQGACLFTLAAGKADRGKDTDTHLDRAEQHRLQLKGQEDRAEGIVALLEGSIEKAVDQVRPHTCDAFPVAPKTGFAQHITKQKSRKCLMKGIMVVRADYADYA